MNRAGLEMIEAESPDQVQGKCVYPLVSEEHREAFKAMTREVFKGKSQTLEFKMIGLKGRPLWLYTHTVPIRNEKGAVVLALAITIDITERKLAEEALHESERSLKTLMSNLPGMAYRCCNDRNWTMEYVSEGAVGLTGYQPADLIGNAKIAYNDLIRPDDQGPVWEAVQKAVGSRDKYTLNYRIRRADGQERWVWEQGQGVFSPAGDLLALEGSLSMFRALPPRRGAPEDAEARIHRDSGGRHRTRLQQPAAGHLRLHFNGQDDPRPEGKGARHARTG